MEPRRRWPRESELIPFRVRTIAIGLQVTGLVLAVMLAWWFLSDRTPMAPRTFWTLWAIGALGAIVASRLPWQPLLGSRRGLWVLYAWSAADIVLISVLIGAKNDPQSPLFFLYALTTIFFAASYPLPGQVALGSFTAAAYLLTIVVAGTDITAAQIVLHLGLLGTIGFMASFISRELIAHLGHDLEESRRAEELFRAISELTSDYAYSLTIHPDGSNEWEWLAGAFERVTGYTPEEATELEGWEALIHADDLPQTLERWETMQRTPERQVNELRLTRKSGDTRWIRAYMQPVVEAGRIVRIYGAVEDITEAKQREEALAGAHEERKRLLTHLVRAKEAERARVASDIHDDSIQIMTSVAIDLERGARRVADPGQRHFFARLEDEVRAAIGRLRAMVFELRPPALDDEGLIPALRLYLEEIRVDMGITYDIHLDLDAEPSSDSRDILYRVAKEALTNVRKHSGATHVDVALERNDGGVLLRVADDGVGINPRFDRSEPGHFGLSEMRERSEMVGGWFRLSANEPSGTNVECWVPIESEVPVA